MHSDRCLTIRLTIIIALSFLTTHRDVVALRNLTAKSSCEAMLSLRQFTGMPTNKFYGRTDPRISKTCRLLAYIVYAKTPRGEQCGAYRGHNQGYDIQGGWVAQKYPKSWHRYIGYILWALRDSPNDWSWDSHWNSITTFVFNRIWRWFDENFTRKLSSKILHQNTKCHVWHHANNKQL